MFEKIDIGIRTFLRDEKLFHALQGLTSNFPGARLIIVDDGDQTEEKDLIYADLHRRGHIIDIMPFDSGFGMKSNRIVDLSNVGVYEVIRPYLLIASDDFVFDQLAAGGLFGLQQVLDLNPTVDIASGRVGKRYYEFDLQISRQPEGVYVREHKLFTPGRPIPKLGNLDDCTKPWYFDCDLTVNYSLMRRKVFDSVAWDDEVKIGGGEHGAFFYDCKLAGLRTVCVGGVNINEQPGRDSQRYKEYRNRALNPDRKCFDNRNIVEYVLGDGTVDYRRVGRVGD